MSSLLLVHVLVGFVAGGLFVALCSLAAEHAGVEIGGLIAGFPSTAVVTLLMVALAESPQRAVEETTFVPAALGLNCILMAAFGLGARFGGPFALLLSLGTWILLAALSVTWVPRQLGWTLAQLGAGFLVGWMLTPGATTKSSPASKPPPWSLGQAAMRTTLGGCVVAIGIALSALGGPDLGGVATGFPAAGFSTLAIVSWSRGTSFAVGLLRPMMLSGSIIILIYALLVRWTYPTLGIWIGTATALAAAGHSERRPRNKSWPRRRHHLHRRKRSAHEPFPVSAVLCFASRSPGEACLVTHPPGSLHRAIPA